MAILGAEWVMRWLPKGTHEWRKFITPEELEASGLGQISAPIFATRRASFPSSTIRRRAAVQRRVFEARHHDVEVGLVLEAGLELGRHGGTDLDREDARPPSTSLAPAPPLMPAPRLDVSRRSSAYCAAPGGHSAAFSSSPMST